MVGQQALLCFQHRTQHHSTQLRPSTLPCTATTIPRSQTTTCTPLYERVEPLVPRLRCCCCPARRCPPPRTCPGLRWLCATPSRSAGTRPTCRTSRRTRAALARRTRCCSAGRSGRRAAAGWRTGWVAVGWMGPRMGGAYRRYRVGGRAKSRRLQPNGLRTQECPIKCHHGLLGGVVGQVYQYGRAGGHRVAT